MLKRLLTMISSVLLFNSHALANPDSLLIKGGDLRIVDSGSGLVFPDGSIQYKATVEGPVGAQGPKGATGTSNTLSIGTVTNGTQAGATITGTAPNQVLNLTLPQGPAGPQGPTGLADLDAVCATIKTLKKIIPAFCSSVTIKSLDISPIVSDHLFNATIAQTVQPLLVSAKLSNDSIENVTTASIWSSSNPSIVSISNLNLPNAPIGTATINSPGTSTVTATYGSLSTTATINVFPMNVFNYSNAGSLVYGPDNNMWFICGNSKLCRITTIGIVTEFPLPSGSAASIVTGPDGNLWFTYSSNPKIGKMTTDGIVTEYNIAGVGTASSITVGPDRNLWFTYSSMPKIGKMTTDGIVTDYNIAGGEILSSITAGLGDTLWFIRVGKIHTITTAGTVTQYAASVVGVGSSIASGPDGSLWFITGQDYGVTFINKLSVNGELTKFSLPSPVINNSTFYESRRAKVSVGPDNNLWFVDGYWDPKAGYNSNTFGKITTAGQITLLNVPGNIVLAFTEGPNGRLWFNTPTYIGYFSPIGVP